MKVVIFGASEFASMAWYCLTTDAGRQVAGFTVDAPFIKEKTRHGLPVIDFAVLQEIFPPDEHELLMHIGGLDANKLRRSKYIAAKDKGYAFINYISSRALTWPDLNVGTNCIIYEGAIIQPFASIGDNVIIRSAAHISHNVTIGDHVFIAASACFGGEVTIENSCFIGLNATIRDGVTVRNGCVIAAGAVVIEDTEPHGIYAGVPARRLKSLPAEEGI